MWNQEAVYVHDRREKHRTEVIVDTGWARHVHILLAKGSELASLQPDKHMTAHIHFGAGVGLVETTRSPIFRTLTNSPMCLRELDVLRMLLP